MGLGGEEIGFGEKGSRFLVSGYILNGLLNLTSLRRWGGADGSARPACDHEAQSPVSPGCCPCYFLGADGERSVSAAHESCQGPPPPDFPVALQLGVTSVTAQRGMLLWDTCRQVVCTTQCAQGNDSESCSPGTSHLKEQHFFKAQCVILVFRFNHWCFCRWRQAPDHTQPGEQEIWKFSES